MKAFGGGPEEIIEIADPRVDLCAFLVVDSTRRGAAFGGIRIRRYASEREALLEAIDLAATMTIKAAAAELPCGGGKLVIMETPGLKRGPAMTRIAATLEALKGRFFAGRDYGMDAADLARLRRTTPYAAVDPIHVPPHAWPVPPGPHRSGTIFLSDAVGRGTLAAIRAALAHAGVASGARGASRAAVRKGRDTAAARRANRGSPSSSRSRRAIASKCVPRHDLAGVRVAVQGLGSVGIAIVRRLVEAGASVSGADTDRRAARAGANAGARILPPGTILSSATDVLVPAAIGGVLDTTAAATCRARIVCGPANNVFVDEAAERAFVDRGIVVVPDCIVGAGALIASALYHLEDTVDLGPEVDRIGTRVLRVLRQSGARNRLPSETVRRMAEAAMPR